MKSLIIANWKMNPISSTQAEEIAAAMELSIKKNCEIVICPPFVFLERVGKLLNKVKLGAQNCSWKTAGPLTGEISPKMLKNFRVSHIIIGHSERRTLCGEDNEMINRKVKAVLKVGLSVVLCIGETREERKKGRTAEILGIQLEDGLKNIKGKIIIAYEPVWAIGSGDACDPRIAEETRVFIEKKLKELLFNDARILYGGSVNSENATDYLKKTLFAGLLVGGSSLNTKEFKKIIDYIDKIFLN